MKISDPDILAAWDLWWAGLTVQQATRRPNLTVEAFAAGWAAARQHDKTVADEIGAALEKMRAK